MPRWDTRLFEKAFAEAAVDPTQWNIARLRITNATARNQLKSVFVQAELALCFQRSLDG